MDSIPGNRVDGLTSAHAVSGGAHHAHHEDESAASDAKRPHEIPLIVIRPKQSRGIHHITDLWSYRELLYYLTWRDVKVRYKQTVLGVAWVLMQPLMTTLVFTIFLGLLARVPFEGASYPLFVYAGLLPWTFFSSALVSGGGSLLGNTHLITKVYFPRLIIPAASVVARLVDICIGFTVLFVMMMVYRVNFTTHLLMLPVLTLLTALLAFGFATLAAATNVRFRDVGMALPVLVQMWMFASPIVYPASLVPENWRRIYALNPIVGIVNNFRAAIFGTPFDWYSLATCAALAVVLIAIAAYWFGRVERTIADVI